MLAISVDDVSKIYRLGEINRGQLFKDVRRWFSKGHSAGATLGEPSGSEPASQKSDLFWALKDVSFDIKEGETVALIGANGAGKSTLLKLISRVTSPSKGTIRMKGRIGSLLEVGTGFNPELTGRDNVFLNGAILGMSKPEIASKFDDIVSFAGIEKFIDTPVKRYSSGMYVRLAFSVAAFLEPEILIIDEVLSVGDQQFQNRCIQRIESIVGDGRTLLFVSHGAGVIRRICQRAVCLKSGEVIFDGDANEAITQYEDSQRPQSAGPDSAAAVPKEISELLFEGDSRPGNEVAQIDSCRLIDLDGQLLSTVRNDQPFQLEVCYTVKKDGHYLRPGCIVVDELGNTLFWTIDTNREYLANPARPGKYRTRMLIPGDFLAPGKVSFGLGVGEHGDNPGPPHFFLPDALQILIADDHSPTSTRGGYHGPVPGFFRPRMQWTTGRHD